MLNESKREPFECLKSFSELNGRRKQGVIVGDNPDARIAKFRFRSRIVNNWPSQGHAKYKAGYIKFENGKKFDLANQTVGGKPAFLFLVTRETDILWRRQTRENEIKDRVDKMAQEDRLAATELIQKLTDSKVDNYFFGQYRFFELLPALSVSQLDDLAELFALPSDGQKGTASPAVAA
ncbi:MAG: hypothetical protein ACLQVM_10410 [Terriglobia bacterium]